MDQALSALGEAKVVSIWYHMNWPSPGNDPWYLNNPSENTARRTYYGVNAIPWGFCDGTQTSLSHSAITNAVNNRIAIPSPYEIEVSGDIGTSSVFVKVKTVSTPPTGNKMLRIAVVEKEYTSPTPYPNGSTHYRTSMLDMVPNASGTLINIAVGDSQSFVFDYDPQLVNFHPSLNHLTIVAFIQNDATREVLQAGYFDDKVGLHCPKASALIEINETVILPGHISNPFSNTTDLLFRIKGQVPAAWNVSANSTQGPIPINGSAQTVMLTGYDSLLFDISADPQGNGGAATLTAKIMSSSDTTLYEELNFSVVTKNVDVLVVDRDGGKSYENYMTNALSQTSYSYGVIPAQAGDLTADDLAGIPAIIWNSGLTEPGLTEDEMNSIGSYLDSGGKLYLNGADIAYQLADPASPFYSQNTLDFFSNYLHANYIQKNYYTLSVDGVGGDPVSDGFYQMKLFGGTGANNLGAGSGKYPNEIAPGDTNASKLFTFWSASSKVAGIRADHGSGKVIFTTFGFESIAEDSNRTKLAQRIVDWFLNPTAIGDPSTPQIVRQLELHQNYPNPFNPETQIEYALPLSDDGARATLIIYNQLGQKVRTLVDEVKPSGRYEVIWNGMDDRGSPVASGVYYYQLVYGNHQAVKKMVLIR